MRSANGSLEFLRRISRRRRSAQGGVESISEYVEQRASLLSPEHLDEVREELPILNLQFAAISVREFPHLQQQLKLLTDRRTCIARPMKHFWLNPVKLR
jgi:hypothetical protein